MLGHGLDEARPAGVIAELLPEGLDALGECFIGDRDASPDFLEKLVLRNELAAIAHQQRKGIEVASIELNGPVARDEPALPRIQHEPFESEARAHFQQYLTTCSCLSGVLEGEMPPLACMEVR